jgi:hypothetical protein
MKKEEEMDKEAIVEYLKDRGISNNTEDKLTDIQNLLLEILNYDFRLLEGIVSDLKIKQPKKTKYFKIIETGQVFEIFLESIQKYNYGIVISGNLVVDKNDDIILGYLDVFSDNPLKVSEIYSYISEHKFLMIANTGYASIMNYDWKLTSQYNKVIFTEEELREIEYVTFTRGKYFKSIGLSNREIMECEVIEEKEARKIPNPLGIVGDLAILEMLTDKYKDNYS